MKEQFLVKYIYIYTLISLVCFENCKPVDLKGVWSTMTHQVGPPDPSFDKRPITPQLCLGYGPPPIYQVSWGYNPIFSLAKDLVLSQLLDDKISGFFGCEIQSGKAIGMNFKARNPCQNFFMHFLFVFLGDFCWRNPALFAAKLRKVTGLKNSTAGSFEPTESTGSRGKNFGGFMILRDGFTQKQDERQLRLS